jgi:adenosylcobinamide kinase / adenosylcobinamide-phosphate guanylyltransferase
VKRPVGVGLGAVLASLSRRDREVRCDAGAAPATVSGEIATRSHWPGRYGREGAAIDDPEPGDLLAALVQPTILGRRSVLPDRSQLESPPPRAGLLPCLTLVLGGARSGKSRYAEALVEAAAPEALYLATAEPLDDEMRERIRRHRARRGERWTTVEEPLDLPARLLAEARRERPILVDCLTLWLSNLLLASRDVARESEALLAVIPRLSVPVLLVANEVGLGIVPENALARAFRDHAGRLNQLVAAQADRVVFLAAGLPLALKEPR